ncbi:hypothetical protein PTKIN_Ptkin02bG0224500 [Pterospermum kingtungense]
MEVADEIPFVFHLPSRPHPLIPQIDEHLCRLKSNAAASSSSSSSIGEKLNGLRDLFELVESLLKLPLTQQSLAQQCNDKQVKSLLQLPLTQQSLAEQCNDKQVNELLNGSLRLLDVCGVAKDAFLQAKEDTRQLQSILRRRGDDAEFTHEAKAYLASRKKAKKSINKSLKDLKSRCGSAHLENDVEATFSMLREVEKITFALFESLLSYINGTKMQSK